MFSLFLSRHTASLIRQAKLNSYRKVNLHKKILCLGIKSLLNKLQHFVRKRFSNNWKLKYNMFLVVTNSSLNCYDHNISHTVSVALQHIFNDFFYQMHPQGVRKNASYGDVLFFYPKNVTIGSAIDQNKKLPPF